MKKYFLLSLLACLPTFSATSSEKVINFNYSKTYHQDSLELSSFSIAYSNWSEIGRYKGDIYLRFNYGDFSSKSDIIHEKRNVSIAYENLFKRKITNSIYRNIIFGLSYGYFDYNRDSLYYAKAYTGVGFQKRFKDFSLDLNLLPEVILTHQRTAKDAINTEFKKYSFGFTAETGFSYYF